MTQEIQLLLLLAIIVAVSKIAGHLSRRYLHQPVVFGEILAGLLLGPSLLNIFGWPVFHPPAADAWRLQDHIQALALVGVLLLMFIAGLETDLAKMRKVGNTALWTAISGVVLPLAGGFIVSRLFGLSVTEAIFIGAVLTATSVSISAQTLMEIGRITSKEGVTIMGAAVIDDILGIIVLSFVIAFGAAHGAENGHVAALSDLIARPIDGVFSGAAMASANIAVILLLMSAFFALAIFLGLRYLHPVLDWADRLHASYMMPAAALVLVFTFAIGAEYVGKVAAITGAYLVGLFLSRTPYAKRILNDIHPITYALFVPVFFMSIGLGADAHQLQRGDVLFTLVIILLAVLTKIVGCGIGARCTGFTTREAVRVGVGMISRGEVGLIVAQVGLFYQVIDAPKYAVLIIMVLVTTVITPVLLRLAFPRTRGTGTDVYESFITVETALEEDS